MTAAVLTPRARPELDDPPRGQPESASPEPNSVEPPHRSTAVRSGAEQVDGSSLLLAGVLIVGVLGGAFVLADVLSGPGRALAAVAVGFVLPAAGAFVVGSPIVSRRLMVVIAASLSVAGAGLFQVSLAAPGPARAGFVSAFLLVGPGAAVVVNMRRLSQWEAAAAVLPASLAIGSLVTAAMLGARVYSAARVAWVLSLVTAIAWVWGVRSRRSPAQPSTSEAVSQFVGRAARNDTAALVASLILLVAFAPQAEVARLGDFGLLGAMPAGWWLGLALALGGVTRVLAAREDRPDWLYALAVATVIGYLHGTVALAYHTPRYYWTFKHLGVVDFIRERSRTQVGIDIYHSWPSFFGLNAAIAHASGARLLLGLATVWPVVLLSGWALALRNLFHNFVDRRVAWAAVVVFVAANWVGQQYFSPQSVGFLLGVWFMSILTSRLMPPEHLRSFGRLWLKRSKEWAGPSSTAVVVVTLVFAAIVISHQLSPYALLPVAFIAAIALDLRPRWLPLLLAALAFGYLAIRWDAVEIHGVFRTVGDLKSNVVVPDAGSALGESRSLRLVNLAGSGVSVLVGIAGLAGLVASRRRLGRLWLPLGAIAASPLSLVAVGQYGDEGLLRVFLFMLPWVSLFAGWLLVRLDGAWRALGASAVALAVVLNLVHGLGTEQAYRSGASEVAAMATVSPWLTQGATMLVAGPRGIPAKLTAGYPKQRVVFLRRSALITNQFGQLDPGRIVAQFREAAEYRPGQRLYFMFSEALIEKAVAFEAFSEDELRGLWSEVASSTSFSPVAIEGSAAVYQWVGAPT